jgi:hypothetical protein
VPEIRCDGNKKFGVIDGRATGIFEAVCSSRFCKQRNNEIVLHIWDLGKINEYGTVLPIDTKRFKKPEVKGIYK